ncbi:MAG: aldo/keto reductase, partial [Cellvibrionaceae bacterium]|nr:aldo/keto reductase [Cellvibrionaceae bacterium]
ASVESLDEAMLCIQQPKISSLQLIFNIFRQRPKQSLLTEAMKKQVGIIARLPLASGVLSGKYTKKTEFDSGDHRNYNKDGQAFSVGETFAGVEFEKAVSLAEKLKVYTGGAPLAQFAQRWILDHPAVTTIITGASSTEQVKNNVAACDLEPISEEIHQKLFDFYLEKVENLVRCEL